jgi:hypothetical protein
MRVFVPASAKTVKALVRSKMTASGSDRMVRAKIGSAASDGQNYSGDDYNEHTLVVASPDSGAQELKIQARAAYSGTAPVDSLLWAVAYVSEAQ